MSFAPVNFNDAPPGYRPGVDPLPEDATPINAAALEAIQQETYDAAVAAAGAAGEQALGAVQQALIADIAAKYAKPGAGIPASDLAAVVQAALSDARTPLAHKSSHATGGGDALTPNDIGAAPAAATTSALAAKADLVGGVVPTAQLPALAINDTFVVASHAAMLALTAQRGDVAVVTADSDGRRRSYILAADAPTVDANWIDLADSSLVQSVNGQAGVIVLAAADVGAAPAAATTTALAGKLAAALLGQANGVAALDSVGKVPAAQLPAAAAIDGGTP